MKGALQGPQAIYLYSSCGAGENCACVCVCVVKVWVCGGGRVHKVCAVHR